MPAVPLRRLLFSLDGLPDLIIEATGTDPLLQLRPQLQHQLPKIDWEMTLLYHGTDLLAWNDTVANQNLIDGTRILVSFVVKRAELPDDSTTKREICSFGGEVTEIAEHDVTPDLVTRDKITSCDLNVVTGNDVIACGLDRSADSTKETVREGQYDQLASFFCDDGNEVTTEKRTYEDLSYKDIRGDFVDEENGQTHSQLSGFVTDLQMTNQVHEESITDEHHEDGVMPSDGQLEGLMYQGNSGQLGVSKEWKEYSDSDSCDKDDVMTESHEYKAMKDEFAGERNNTGQSIDESGRASGQMDASGTETESVCVAVISSGIEVDHVDQLEVPLMPDSV